MLQLERICEIGEAAGASLRKFLFYVQENGDGRAYSMALPMSSMIFLASPNTIMVLSM